MPRSLLYWSGRGGRSHRNVACERPPRLRPRRSHPSSRGGDQNYFLREDALRVVRRDVPFVPALVLLFFFAAPFLPPPVSLLTVAQARRSDSSVLRPRRL